MEGLLPVPESVDRLGLELGSPGFSSAFLNSEVDQAKHLWNSYDILGTVPWSTHMLSLISICIILLNTYTTYIILILQMKKQN